MSPSETPPASALITDLRACTTFAEIADVLVAQMGFTQVVFTQIVRGTFPVKSGPRPHWSAPDPAPDRPGWRGEVALVGDHTVWERAHRLFLTGAVNLSHVQGVETGLDGGEARQITFTVWLDADMYAAMWLAEKLREGLPTESEDA